MITIEELQAEVADMTPDDAATAIIEYWQEVRAADTSGAHPSPFLGTYLTLGAMLRATGHSPPPPDPPS